jgi:hypothetical protein
MRSHEEIRMGMSVQLFINAISHSTLTINKIFKESITIITLIIYARGRVIIVTSLVVGALISALILLRTKLVVGVDEVEVLMGLGTGIARISNISTDFTSHVGFHGFECLLGTHLLIMFYSLCEQIHLNYKHVNFFN